MSKEGTTALIGAPGDSSKAGAAWVFTSSSEGAWSQQGEKLTGSGETGEGSFGRSVGLSSEGNTALVGGPADDANVGAAWVFTRSEAGAWTQQGDKLTGSGETGEGSFGGSVALSSDGDIALVGGPADNTNIGAAWVLTRSEAGAWTQQGDKLTGSGETGEGSFGGSVALSSDGNTALVGGPADNTNIGAAWAFVNPPTVSNVTPNEGPEAGGTSVTITGTNFNEAAAVEFGSIGATSFEVISATSITAVAPAGAGTVDVSVTTSGGTSATNSADKFSYVPVPTVVTKAASSITQTTATLNATVNPNGGEVSNCNFEYGTTELYESSVPCSLLPGSGTEPVAVSATLESLSANTTYHFRIVATNLDGTSTDILNAQTFETLPNAPTVVTDEASSIAQTTATLNATVNPNGGEVGVGECKLEYGTTIAYGHEVPCSSLPGSGTGAMAVSAAVIGLSANTTYHFRVVATNAGGTGTGGDGTFKTLPNPPTVVTGSGSPVTQTTATLNATVNPNSGEIGTCYFEYGETASYGYRAPCSASPGSGASQVAVSASVTGLTKNTTYHFRIVAGNTGGTSAGADQAFETAPGPPTVIAGEPSAIGQTSAVLNAEINPNGGVVTQCYFHYERLTSEPEVIITPCVGLPLSGKSPVKISALAEGLSASTRYDVSLEVINSFGEDAFGEGSMPFETLPGPEVVTGAASLVTQTSATLNAMVNPNGGEVSKLRVRIRHVGIVRVQAGSLRIPAGIGKQGAGIRRASRPECEHEVLLPDRRDQSGWYEQGHPRPDVDDAAQRTRGGDRRSGVSDADVGERERNCERERRTGERLPLRIWSDDVLRDQCAVHALAGIGHRPGGGVRGAGEPYPERRLPRSNRCDQSRWHGHGRRPDVCDPPERPDRPDGRRVVGDADLCDAGRDRQPRWRACERLPVRIWRLGVLRIERTVLRAAGSGQQPGGGVGPGGEAPRQHDLPLPDPRDQPGRRQRRHRPGVHDGNRGTGDHDDPSGNPSGNDPSGNDTVGNDALDTVRDPGSEL